MTPEGSSSSMNNQSSNTSVPSATQDNPPEPLAARMRPVSLDEVVGQAHLIGAGQVVRTLIETDNLSSILFWGPPGSGKTTLAKVIAQVTNSEFATLNASSAGVKDVRGVIDSARAARDSNARRTILFLDEIHRFNKSQQDALLPAVESGLLVLIGATTENPFFEINSPLLSRLIMFRLEPLSNDDLSVLITRALTDERGLADEFSLTETAQAHILDKSDGDARRALNVLELASQLATADERTSIEQGDIESALNVRFIAYDKAGDNHYDVISAFIKSMRGSDPNAAVYWLARMITAGEDPRFIARRMIVFASEDIGLANSQALATAVAAAQAVEHVGLPEARINLAHAALFLARCVKSNSVIGAIDSAMADVEAAQAAQVPLHLREASYRGAKKLGHGKGYKYPHSYPGHVVDQTYLPDNMVGRTYYRPSGQGKDT